MGFDSVFFIVECGVYFCVSTNALRCVGFTGSGYIDIDGDLMNALLWKTTACKKQRNYRKKEYSAMLNSLPRVLLNCGKFRAHNNSGLHNLYTPRAQNQPKQKKSTCIYAH